jgi:hypothetical protein
MILKSFGLSCGLLALTLHSLFSQGLSFNQDFDHGSLDVSRVVVKDDRVILAGRDNFNRGRWKWIHFEVSGAKDRRLIFEIGDNFASGGNALRNLQMVYSHDGENWAFFDQNRRDSQAKTFTFSNDSAFEEDRIVIAYSFPYPYQRVVDHVNRINESPWVSPTRSGDLNLVIGQSAGGTDCVGRGVPPHDLFGFVITDPTVDLPKVKISITGGVHANEVLANHVLEGLIDFLVGEDPRADQLRQSAEFFIYPMVNPDGRFAGYNRGGVEHVSRDTNRFWDEDLYGDMKEIRTVAEALVRDTEGSVTWHIDFHSWSNTSAHFVILNREVLQTGFWEALKELEPAMLHRISEGSARTGRWFGHHRLGAEFSLTPETMFRPGENIERYHAMGRNFGIALSQEVSAQVLVQTE